MGLKMINYPQGTSMGNGVGKCPKNSHSSAQLQSGVLEAVQNTRQPGNTPRTTSLEY